MRFDFSFVNQRNSRIAGFVLALCFVGFTLLSTNKLIQRIQENERQQMELWGIAQQELATSTDLNKPVNPLTFQVLTGENTIPMIVVDHDNKLLFSNNIDDRKLVQDSIGYVEKLIQQFSAIHTPIEILDRENLNQKMY